MHHLRNLRLLTLGFGLYHVGLGLGGQFLLPYLQWGTEGQAPWWVWALLVAVGLGISALALRPDRLRALRSLVAIALAFDLPLGSAYGCYAMWIMWFNEDTRGAFANPGPPISLPAAPTPSGTTSTS
jgi:hypothetical protein